MEICCRIFRLICRIWGKGGGQLFFSVFARPLLFLWDVKWKEHARYWTCDQDNIKTKTKRLRVHRILHSVSIKYLENFNSDTWNCTCIYCLPISFDMSYIHSLIPWCRVLLEKLIGLQLVKKFPAFYGTRRFITTQASATCPYPEPAQSSPHTHIPPPGDPS